MSQRRVVTALMGCLLGVASTPAQGTPNILLCMADDWSWPHAGALGDVVVQTPAFDRVASEGLLLTHAFANAPSCTPSRAALLTGQHIWRLGEGANLWSTLSAGVATYADLLNDAGYAVGHEVKGWGPGWVTAGGRAYNPAGPEFASLAEFLDDAAGRPFCYWLGSELPHRPYPFGFGVLSGLDPEQVTVPPILPDHDVVRRDLADYYASVQLFDRTVAAALAELDARGLLDDTIVVVTSDNGMPFPRCKTELYDAGTRVPLAVRWPAQVPAGRVVSDFVHLADLAPTLLEAAGLAVPAGMTARSMLGVWTSSAAGRVDPSRDRVLLARERHVPQQRCVPVGYPMRGLRTDGFLYVRNLEPSRWPVGIPDPLQGYNGYAYASVDESPTKSFMVDRSMDPTVAPLFDLAFGRRPAAELYDLGVDPHQMVNVVDDPAYAAVLVQMTRDLDAALAATADPRHPTSSGGAVFDLAAYHAPIAPPTLTVDVTEIGLAVGGRQTLRIAAGPAHAGQPFVLLGSSSGTAPGFPLAGAAVPLNPDAYTSFTLAQPNPLVVGGVGMLDAMGGAIAQWSVGPAVLPSSAQGLALHHAHVVLPAAVLPAAVLAVAGNPCALTLR